MHPDIATALHLQEIDLRIHELRREIATLPRQIAEIEKTLESHVKRLELDKLALAANQRERKSLDVEAQTQQQKISKLRDQMLQAKTNEQYRAFQHEIQFCETAIRKAEDKILDLMGEAEGFDATVKSSEKSLAEERQVVESEKRRATSRTNEDKAELEKDKAERSRASSSIPKQVLDSYERLRARYKDGIVIAEASEGRCTACNIMLRPQFFQELRLGESVLACENCRRILYVQPKPVDIEAQMNT